jgi:hypothetical protein
MTLSSSFSNWQFVLQEQCILCVGAPLVNWDVIAQDWQERLVGFDCDVINVESGADREQIWFELNQVQYVLLIEPLCESIWIETVTSESSALPALFSVLISR